MNDTPLPPEKPASMIYRWIRLYRNYRRVVVGRRGRHFHVFVVTRAALWVKKRKRKKEGTRTGVKKRFATRRVLETDVCGAFPRYPRVRDDEIWKQARLCWWCGTIEGKLWWIKSWQSMRSAARVCRLFIILENFEKRRGFFLFLLLFFFFYLRDEVSAVCSGNLCRWLIFPNRSVDKWIARNITFSFETIF